MAASAIDVSDGTFEAEVMKSALPVVLEFWSPECMHCRKMAPVVDKLAEEFAGRVKVAKVNVLENAVTPERFGVSGVPAFFYLNGGEVAAKTLGAMPKGKLKKELGINKS